MMRIYTYITLLMMTGCVIRCKEPILPHYTDQEVVHQWADMTLYITKNTPANSPTFASRALGYIGLTMYESIVHGYPEYRSLVGQLKDLDTLPLPTIGLEYHWAIVLNAGQAEILRLIYNQTSDSNKLRIDSLEHTIYTSIVGSAKKNTIEHSIRFGRTIADHIFIWSGSDGGHRAYLRNFNKKMTYPNHPGSWKPPLYGQSFSHYPLHPQWGKNRTFVPDNALIPVPAVISFDSSKTSPYYQQFLKVYEKEKVLTQEEKEIAIWWGDDPDVTFTPPGHSYYLTATALKAKKIAMIDCALIYAQVGMAVGDAFINCWKWKYQFFSERPNTFIPTYMDQNWESFWPDPPFPAFPSGHAIQGAASTSILIHHVGDSFSFIDSAHFGRKRDGLRNVDFKPRSYSSFTQVAKEIADSRFYGGIHTPQDNDAGLRAGAVIGKNVLALKWKK